MSARPTRDGLVVGALTLALTAVALTAGNNLLYLVASAGWAALLVSLVAGPWNLRGLQAHRALPADVFAGLAAPGRVVLSSGRRWLPAVAVEVDDGGAVALVDEVPPGCEASAGVTWRFARRGVARLGPIVLRSSFPFGLIRFARAVARPAEVPVYPRPTRASVGFAGEDLDGHELSAARPGRGGDFVGLRAYRPGDRPASVHWRSSARVGALLVVEGRDEAAPRIEVVVRDGGDREQALSRAAGEILDGLGRGLRVGLVLPAFDGAPTRRLPPGSGDVCRRALLEALARVPEAP